MLAAEPTASLVWVARGRMLHCRLRCGKRFKTQRIITFGLPACTALPFIAYLPRLSLGGPAADARTEILGGSNHRELRHPLRSSRENCGYSGRVNCELALGNHSAPPRSPRPSGHRPCAPSPTMQISIPVPRSGASAATSQRRARAPKPAQASQLRAVPSSAPHRRWQRVVLAKAAEVGRCRYQISTHSLPDC